MNGQEQPNTNPGGVAPGFLKRLSYYLIGITIGFVMLGLIHQARQRAVASNAAQQNDADTPQSPTQSPTRPPDEQGDEPGG